MSLRLVMMGPGRFATPSFKRMRQSSHQVVGLLTQPDRTGRGHHHHVNPMKELAVAHGVPVWQPDNVNLPESREALRTLDADVCVVAAYGQILSAELLAIPRLGFYNIHASILPKYRGAAPIQFAIFHGETETGVSIFRIEPKLDAGPVLGISTLKIDPKETAGDLEVRLAALAPELLMRILDDLEHDRGTPIPQDPAAVTKAPRLKKTDGLIDWSETNRQIDRRVFAMQPWPKPVTYLHQPGHRGIRLLLLDVEPVDIQTSAQPGEVISVEQGTILVAATNGAVELRTVQPDGKRPMSAADFLNGHSIRVGDRFDSTP